MSSASPRPDSHIVAGRYAIQAKLGSGSIGTVYLSTDLATKSAVALKLIRTDRIDDNAVRKLKEEFRTLASLKHPSIAQALDFGYTADRLPFYTREHIVGDPLPGGPPPESSPSAPGEYLRPILDLLGALEYLHGHGILHLDIHAGNVIVSTETRGGVLIDFGLVAQRAGTRLISSRGSSFLADLANEPPSVATDLRATGRLLLYRLTGRYDGDHRLPREIRGWEPHVLLALERVIDKAMATDPAQRFLSAREMREAIAQAVGAPAARRELGEPPEQTIGRDEEIGRIEAAVGRALSGHAAVLWIHGPSGVGKTRLLTDVRWRAQLRGLDVVGLEFLRHGGSPTAERQIRAALRGRSELVRWLDDGSSILPGSPGERARRQARACFENETAPPVALLFDDLDHADRESRALAEALAREALGRAAAEAVGRGVLVVIATRRPPDASVAPGRKREGSLPVRPLTLGRSVELLRSLLRPLEASDAILRACSRDARGNPRRLRQIARAIRERYGALGKVPARAKIPSATSNADFDTEALPASVRRVLEVIALFGVATRWEIAAALRTGERAVARALRTLEEEELIGSAVDERRRVYSMRNAELESLWRARVPPRRARTLHRAAANDLLEQPSRTMRDGESLARHLIACGDHRAARPIVHETARELARGASLERGAELLRQAMSATPSPRARLEYAEAASEICARIGDHAAGVAILEPLFAEQALRWRGRDAIRLRRRLGVHLHRAGDPARAIELFEEARQLSDPDLDREELVIILSELGEIHTFRGEHDAAEAACREGLDLLGDAPEPLSEFTTRMQVTLRASLGHLELRRMRLDVARAEFLAALRLARDCGDRANEALILTNLGIVENQLNRFASARKRWQSAERLLDAVGERATVVQTSANLAVLAAKMGDANAALDSIARAMRRARDYPGRRLEFFIVLSRGLVDHLLGRLPEAIENFRQALPMGRELGDTYLVRFGEIYLGETLLLSGQYVEASRVLKRVLRSARGSDGGIVRRMASIRLALIEHLLGRPAAARKAQRIYVETPRSGVVLLEAWNDVFAALSGRDDAREPLDRARRTFGELGLEPGLRFVRVALVASLVRSGDLARLRALLLELERVGPSSHRVLRVLEPLARAEIAWRLGEAGRVSLALSEATAEIVGLPLLEADLRIDFLRALVAQREGDRATARHHLHRSLQTRELIARGLPADGRRTYLTQERFRALDELGEKLERLGSLRSTAPVPDLPQVVRKVIARSSAMRRLVTMLFRMRDAELPVLITGETGAGKELIARCIHALGPRSDALFEAIHCSAIPAELFESELFGHGAGAFTGAEVERPGLLEHIERGTALLDDIENLAPDLQKKLAQVIESRRIRPLGSVEPRTIDVRFLASSSMSGDEAMRAGKLIPELYFRLRAIELRVPPLRERLADLPELVEMFVAEAARRLERPLPRVDGEAMEELSLHDWPGNVRELEAISSRLVLESSPGETITAAHVRGVISPRESPTLFSSGRIEDRSLADLKRELERAYLERLFRSTGGNIAAMLERLEIKRSNLYTWFAKLGLDIRAMREDLRERERE